MSQPLDNVETALCLAEQGIVCIPCHPGTKVAAVKWKEWQTSQPATELLEEWFSDARRNIAMICTGLVIFDCDDPAKAEAVIEQCGDTPVKTRTPRGGLHLPYRRRRGIELRNQVKIKGMSLDIRTDAGLAMIPNSQTQHGRYEWLGKGLHEIESLRELPVANIGWTRERVKRKVALNIDPSSLDVMMRRARAWVACVEGAIAGQRGHDKTFRVACKLTHPQPRGFGLSFEQAWPIFLEWNEQCEPLWSEKELIHKLDDAIKRR